MSATKTELSSPRGVEQQLQADQSRLAMPLVPPIDGFPVRRDAVFVGNSAGPWECTQFHGSEGITADASPFARATRIIKILSMWSWEDTVLQGFILPETDSGTQKVGDASAVVRNRQRQGPPRFGPPRRSVSDRNAAQRPARSSVHRDGRGFGSCFVAPLNRLFVAS